MVFAWSVTEVIRYSFYTLSLSGFHAYPLVWLRYTAFYVLYPLGASSEVSLIYVSLPYSSMWNLTDYIRASLFLIWWLGRYIGRTVVPSLTFLYFARFLWLVHLHAPAASQSSSFKRQAQRKLTFITVAGCALYHIPDCTQSHSPFNTCRLKNGTVGKRWGE
jgi:hypothetical protein